MTRIHWLISMTALLGVAHAEDLGSIIKRVDSLGFMKPIPISVAGDRKSVV